MGTGISDGTSISPISGHKVMAEIRLGDNDATGGGDWESMISGAGASGSSAQLCWHEEPESYIDSGEVGIQLVLNAGGGTNGTAWTVTQGGVAVPLSFSGSYGAISSVKVRAAATFAGGWMVWGDLMAKFYKNGNLAETITYNTVVVDTRELEEDPAVREQILTITPTNSDNTKLVITGTARLYFYDAGIPAPTTVFGQIYVFAA